MSMRLREINKKEFENFCKQSEQNNFFQSKFYAEIKRKEGYHTYFVGLDQNGNIRAATMLISKDVTLFKKRMFYAPHGFIIDYKNLELLNLFTSSIKEFIKEKKGIYVKIEPYLALHDRNYDGSLVPGGFNNSKAVDNLLSLKWNQKQGEELEDSFEPSYIYQLNLKGKNEQELFANFDSSLQKMIQRNETIGIHVRKLDQNNYSTFLDIFENSSDIANYLNIDQKNYKDICNILRKHNLLDITIAELDIDQYLTSTINSKNNIKNNPGLEEQLNKQIESIKTLQYKYGHKILLGGIISVIYGKEYLNLVTATIDRFHNFNPLTTLYWETIKDSKKKGCEIYNFYGIGDILEDNKKLEELKKYHGKVIELIGEFDFVIHELSYKRQMKKQANKHRY